MFVTKHVSCKAELPRALIRQAVPWYECQLPILLMSCSDPSEVQPTSLMMLIQRG